MTDPPSRLHSLQHLWKRHRRYRETGAGSMAIGAFVLALLVGAGGGLVLRRSQPPNVPPMDLALPGSTIALDTTLAPSSTLVLPVTEGSTVAETVPETTVPETTVPETTEVPLPPQTDPPVTEPPLRADLSLGAGSSTLRPAGGSRPVDVALGCDGFTATPAPGAAVDCGDLNLGDVPAKWVASTSGELEVLAKGQSADGSETWNIVLRGTNAGRSTAPFLADVSGDGVPDLVAAWNDGGVLRIDVATVSQGGADPTMHVELPGGRARIDRGQLNVWFDSGKAGQLTRAIIELKGGSWVTRPLEEVAVEAAPASEL